MGRLPLGYVSSRGSERTGTIQRDEFTLELIEEARKMREEGHSVRVIRKVMAQRGLVGKAGRPLSVSTLHGLLGRRDFPGKNNGHPAD